MRVLRRMKFYISTTGIKRVTISNEADSESPASAAAAAMKGKGVAATGSSRRISYRTVLPAVLVLGIVLPFVFVRIAFLVLESTTACSSSVGNFFLSYLLFPPSRGHFWE